MPQAQVWSVLSALPARTCKQRATAAPAAAPYISTCVTRAPARMLPRAWLGLVLGLVCGLVHEARAQESLQWTTIVDFSGIANDDATLQASFETGISNLDAAYSATHSAASYDNRAGRYGFWDNHPSSCNVDPLQRTVTDCDCPCGYFEMNLPDSYNRVRVTYGNGFSGGNDDSTEGVRLFLGVDIGTSGNGDLSSVVSRTDAAACTPGGQLTKNNPCTAVYEGAYVAGSSLRIEEVQDAMVNVGSIKVEVAQASVAPGAAVQTTTQHVTAVGASTVTIPENSHVDILLVAGGGGGGNYWGGGGGGGEVVLLEQVPMSGVYNIVVGGGGTKGVYHDVVAQRVSATNGGDTTIEIDGVMITAHGGGAGGSGDNSGSAGVITGAAGGSGGGGPGMFGNEVPSAGKAKVNTASTTLPAVISGDNTCVQTICTQAYGNVGSFGWSEGYAGAGGGGGGAGEVGVDAPAGNEGARGGHGICRIGSIDFGLHFELYGTAIGDHVASQTYYPDSGVCFGGGGGGASWNIQSDLNTGNGVAAIGGGTAQGGRADTDYHTKESPDPAQRRLWGLDTAGGGGAANGGPKGAYDGGSGVILFKISTPAAPLAAACPTTASATQEATASAGTWNAELKAHDLAAGDTLVFAPQQPPTLDVARGFTAVLLARPDAAGQTGDLVTLKDAASAGGTTIARLGADAGAVAVECPGGPAALPVGCEISVSTCCGNSGDGQYIDIEDACIRKYFCDLGASAGLVAQSVQHYRNGILLDTFDIDTFGNGQNGASSGEQNARKDVDSAAGDWSNGDVIRFVNPTCSADPALHAQAEGLGVYALVLSDDATNAKVYAPDAGGNFLHAGVGVGGCSGFADVGVGGVNIVREAGACETTVCTWDQANTIAQNNGGRLVTAQEMSNWLTENGRIADQNMWAPVYNDQIADPYKDWMQVGKDDGLGHHTGRLWTDTGSPADAISGYANNNVYITDYFWVSPEATASTPGVVADTGTNLARCGAASTTLEICTQNTGDCATRVGKYPETAVSIEQGCTTSASAGTQNTETIVDGLVHQLWDGGPTSGANEDCSYNANGKFVQVDLGTSKNIQLVKIYGRMDDSYTDPVIPLFDILVDNVACATSITIPNKADGAIASVDCVATGKEVKLQLSNSQSAPLSVCEFEVYGSRTGGAELVWDFESTSDATEWNALVASIGATVDYDSDYLRTYGDDDSFFKGGYSDGYIELTVPTGYDGVRVRFGNAGNSGSETEDDAVELHIASAQSSSPVYGDIATRKATLNAPSSETVSILTYPSPTTFEDVTVGDKIKIIENRAEIYYGIVITFRPKVSTPGALAAGYSLTLGGGSSGFSGLLGEAFVAPRALSRAELGLAIHGLAGYDGTEPTGDYDRWYTFDGDLASYHDRADRRRAAAEHEAQAVVDPTVGELSVANLVTATLTPGTEVYAPAPARRLYALEVAAAQTLDAPVAGTFAWTGAWTVAAWLRAGAGASGAVLSVVDGGEASVPAVQAGDIRSSEQFCQQDECTAAQSSLYAGLGADLGIDGNYCQDMSDYSGLGSWGGAADCNVCTHTSSDTDPWWRVDLGSIRPVTLVKVWGRSDAEQDRLDDFKITISTSDDRTTGTTCATTGSIPSATSYQKDVLCAANGRYVFVHRTEVTDSMTVCEVEIWGFSAAPPAWTHVALTYDGSGTAASLHVDGAATATTVDVSTLQTAGGSVRITGAGVDDLRVYTSDLSTQLQQAGAPAATACPAGQAIGIRNLARECGATFDQPCSTTASSQLDATNGNYALINDGNTDASFYTGVDDPAWIQIDLGEQRVIKSVQIDMHQGEYSRINNFMLIVGGVNALTDGTAACYTDDTGYTSHTVIDVTCAGTGQYVFLKQPAKTGLVNHLHIREMRVYGERCVPCDAADADAASCAALLPAIPGDTGGWRLVRHIPASTCTTSGSTETCTGYWYTGNDNLAGFDIRAPDSDYAVATASEDVQWTKEFGNFDEYLISSGDQARWIQFAKTELVKVTTTGSASTAQNPPGVIVNSHLGTVTGTFITWWRGTSTTPEDPGIYYPSQRDEDVLYQEHNADPGNQHFWTSNRMKALEHGINVFVREAPAAGGGE